MRRTLSLEAQQLVADAELGVERLRHAMNLLENNAVEWFAKYTSTDGCDRTFGVGIAMNLDKEDPRYGSIWPSEMVIVFGRAHWITHNHKIIDVWDPDGFKQFGGKARALPEGRNPDDIFSVSNTELGGYFDAASMKLDEAIAEYKRKRRKI